MRLGGQLPKALQPLKGDSLLRHALRRLAAAASVGWVVVAAPPGYEEATHGQLPEQRVSVVTGGGQRQQSVATALAAVPAGFEIVLIHDAARALAPVALFEAVAAAVRAGHDAVIPVLPVTDTITRVGPAGEAIETPDRATLRAVQTPQGFRRAVLETAHAAAPDATATDDAGLVARLGVPVHTLPGSPYALKITTRYDLLVATAMLESA